MMSSLPTSVTQSYGTMGFGRETLSLSAVHPGATVWDNVAENVFLVSVIMNSMSAGIIFIFSNTIMPALAKMEQGAQTMVLINKIILNPLFVFIFMGGTLLSAIPTIYMWYKQERYDQMVRYLSLAGTVIYFFGQALVTITQNVPRNDALLELSIGGDEEKLTNYWQEEFLTGWVRWNTTRGVFATIASILGGIVLRMLPP